MNRRTTGWWLAACFAALAPPVLGFSGCALPRADADNTTSRSVATASISAEITPDPSYRAGVSLVFVAMPEAAPFQATRKSLLSELGKAFNISTFVVRADTTAEAFRAALEHDTPACLVLMNNSTVRMYRDYQRARQRARPGMKFPPAVVVMTSYLEDSKGDLIDATGISYEVPGVTAFVGLRAIVKTSISRVGVIHLHSSAAFIERERQLAAKEHITIVPIEVSNQPTLKEIQNAFRAFRAVHHVNALWILNDNRLLREGRFLIDVWQPQLENLGVPVIVGAAPLVNAQASFGTFAVLPDHAGLGVQAASLIFDLAESGWHVADHPVELPLSTINVLDVAQAREKFGLRAGALNRVDQLLE